MSKIKSSPCRSWPTTPAARRHTCSAEHAALVRDYRDARLAYESQRERETHDEPAAMAEYDRAHGGGMTFRTYLTSTRGARS